MTDFEIDDEDNLVDRAKKRSIVDKRDEIDEWRKELIPKVKFGEITEAQAVSLIHDRVRDYLMAIEPVIVAKQEEDLYEHRELGDVVIPVPSPYNDPDGNGITFENGEPEPRRVTIEGVRSVIEGEVVTGTWEKQIRVEDSGEPRRTEVFRNSVPFSREVLRNAVRETDQWLQMEDLGIAVKDEIEVGEEDIDPL